MEIKNTAEKKKFTTGASRSGTPGRGRFSLMPMRGLLQVCKVMEGGALVHAERNWEKGIPESAYIDSMYRHLTAFLTGKSDEPHLSMVVWNALCMLETRLRVQEGLLPEELLDMPETGHGVISDL